MADGQTSMKIKKSAARVLLGLAALALSATIMAQDSAAPAAAPTSGQGDEYSDKGADRCLVCHAEETDTFSAAAIFKSKHGHRGDARAPFGPGGLQCEACHGPGARHAAKGSKKTLTINAFKASSFLPVETRNGACLTCHENNSRTAWHIGAHDRSRLACTDCHKVHVERDAVLTKSTEQEVCFRCHTKQRADFQKASAHPVRSGRMGCSDCHNVHGTSNPAMLTKPTLNQACYSCHADKRGPVLWEHAPVAEDCSLCHSAHGSVRAALLTKTPPLLCQQCHTSASHPAIARTGAALPGAAAGSAFLLVGSCTNCHSQVHGSNHPSGAKLMR
jgi:DmsE family decaheme c-type cytochrome